MLGLSDRKFKIAVINTLRALMRKKVDNVQTQMGNGSRRMEILRKFQKEVLEVKNTSKINNVFLGFLNRLDMDEERVKDLEDRSIETS